MAEKESSSKKEGGGGACPACGAEGVRLKNSDGVLICDKCASKKFSNKVREKLNEQFEKQQEHARKEAYQRRLLITKSASDYLRGGKVQDAINTYAKYMEVLETRFRTSKENLHPHMFDQKTDDQELLLVTAVFWDLSTTYDKLKGPAFEKEFRINLQKFVEFSIGAPYMVLSAETIRKYIEAKKAVHRAEFNDAHNAIRLKMPKCFISSVTFGPYSSETVKLQLFRDLWLLPRWWGPTIIKLYYSTSPYLATIVAQTPSIRKPIQIFLRTLIVPFAERVTPSKIPKSSKKTNE